MIHDTLRHATTEIRDTLEMSPQTYAPALAQILQVLRAMDELAAVLEQQEAAEAATEGA